MALLKTVVGTTQVLDIPLRYSASHLFILGYHIVPNGGSPEFDKEKISIKTNGNSAAQTRQLCSKAKVIDLANYAVSGEGFFMNVGQYSQGTFVYDVMTNNVLPRNSDGVKANIMCPILLSPNGGYSLENQEYLSISLFDLNPKITYEIYAFQALGGGTLVKYDDYSISVGESTRVLDVSEYETLILPVDKLEEIQISYGGSSVTYSLNELLCNSMMTNDINQLRTDNLDIGSSPLLAINLAHATQLQIVSSAETGYNFLLIDME